MISNVVLQGRKRGSSWEVLEDPFYNLKAGEAIPDEEMLTVLEKYVDYFELRVGLDIMGTPTLTSTLNVIDYTSKLKKRIMGVECES